MITKDNNFKVMELFFKYPQKSFHIRELARLTGLSATGIIKIVKRLKKENLLVSHKTDTTEEISPNTDANFFHMKRLYNIYSLYDVGLIEMLKKYYEYPKAIILFGSYVNGTDSEKSDIDIAIFASQKEIPDITEFEKKLARKINIHVLTVENISREFKNSLANGITLEGFVELI
ncbi:nucleotidyltransferase domain-containing protein [Candidatus Woesearchaeota archaeon]|nr:nucleotidyltransferase domain-containing protein [Candidatus Woesearchaeota archaeon]